MRLQAWCAVRRRFAFAAWLAAGAVVIASCQTTTSPTGANTGVSDTAASPTQMEGQSASTTSSASPTSTSIHIGIPDKNANVANLYVAQDLGLFQQAGLSVTIDVMRPAAAIAAVQSGEMAFTSAIGSAAQAAERGLPLRIVLVSSDRPPFLLVGDKGVTQLGQLRGATIAVFSPGTSGTEITIELLRQDGLDPGTYEFIYSGDDPGHVALLTNHQVAATALTLSNAIPLLDQGYPLLDSAINKVALPQVGLATSLSEIQSQPDTVSRAISAVMEATRLMATDRDLVLPVLMTEFALQPNDAAATYDQLQRSWTTNGRPSPAAMQFGFQLDQQNLELQALPNASDVYDFSFLPAEQGNPAQ